jgi:hypothetical protein
MEDNLPAYAIIELSIRVAMLDADVGHYLDHKIYDTGIVVKMSKGIMKLSTIAVVLQQLHPDKINDGHLKDIAGSFRVY